MIKETKTYLVEVDVNATPGQGVKLPFPQNLGELQRATIIGIEVYSESDINKSPTGKTPVSLSGCKSAVLNVYNNTNEHIRQQPLIGLMPTQQGGIIREFVPFKWNVNKSNIQLFASTDVTLGESFIINFIYLL